MKKTHTLLLLCLVSVFAYAQLPQAINYQAAVRNAQGNLVTNQLIKVRLTIKNLTASGNILYQETHSATTNSFGLFSVSIGQGTVASGTFAAINWAQGDKFLQVEFDPNGGNTYTDMGTTQLISVPYAYHANTANYLGAERIERLSVDGICNATPCTISRQSGNWVTSVDRISLGFYQINFAPGTFSETPTCICSGGPANSRSAEIFQYNGTSSVTLKTQDPSVAIQDLPFQLICMGKK